MRIQIRVDAEEFWTSLEDDIRSARDYVYVQTLSYEGDRVGKALSQSLVESKAADRRMISDEFYTKYRINDHFIPNPRHWFNSEIRAERDETLRVIEHLTDQGVRFKMTNPSGPLYALAFLRNHKKIVAVDDRVAYIGGFNFSEHNFHWHDMMLRIEDPEVTGFLKQDFLDTWAGKHLNTSRTFDDIEIFRFDARSNAKTFRPVLELIGNARESVFVLSPYFTYPFYEKLRQARANGASVVIITPEINNWPVMKEYTLWESMRAGFDVRLYPERMMHLKAVLIDDEYLIVGSSNFDFLSCSFLQEIIAVVTDRDAIVEFKERVLERDLAKSVAIRPRVPSWKGYYHLIRFKCFTWLFTGIHALFSPRR